MCSPTTKTTPPVLRSSPRHHILIMNSHAFFSSLLILKLILSHGFVFFHRPRRTIRTHHRSGGSGNTRPPRGSISVRTAGEGVPSPACCRNTSGRTRTTSGRTPVSPVDSPSKPRATCVRKPDSSIRDGTETGIGTGNKWVVQGSQSN